MSSNEIPKYSYDYLSDALAIDISNNQEYHDTITLEKNNIIIDIDKNKFPLSIEILDGSKMLGVEKNLLKKSSLRDLQLYKNGKKTIMKILIVAHRQATDKINASNSYSINEGLNELIIEVF
jgi:uncharacterized protein YuzE